MKFTRKLSILTKKKIVEFYKSGLKGEKQIRQEYGVSPLLLEKLVRWYNRYFLNPQKNYYQTVKSRAMARPKKKRKTSENAREKALEKELKLLKQKNQKLEKALKWEELKTKVYETMVDIAEKEFDLPIRKKFGTKQFEK